MSAISADFRFTTGETTPKTQREDAIGQNSCGREFCALLVLLQFVIVCTRYAEKDDVANGERAAISKAKFVTIYNSKKTPLASRRYPSSHSLIDLGTKTSFALRWVDDREGLF